MSHSLFTECNIRITMQCDTFVCELLKTPIENENLTYNWLQGLHYPIVLMYLYVTLCRRRLVPVFYIAMGFVVCYSIERVGNSL